VSGDVDVFEAPGLSADWLNAWLAAIGVTLLLPGVKLSWTDEPSPTARFSLPEGSDFISELDAALPTQEWLEQTPIAPVPSGAAAPMARSVDQATYADRAHLARARSDCLLAASVTDLVMLDPGAAVATGPLNPPVPKGITLASRAINCAKVREADRLSALPTLRGTAVRRKGNGLGFDPRRLSGAAENVDNYTDPVLELLTLSSFPLFPLRGDGGRSPRQRGWTARATATGGLVWCAWLMPLDCWAIDAFLDLPRLWGGPSWRTVPYRPANASDPTRAYFSEPVP
jgi:hypothetical protein